MSAEELSLAARRLAAAPRLLVAADFDGTLAPLTDRPADSRMLVRAAAALRLLAAQANTCVAVISGRDLDSLSAVCPPLPGVTLIGSYGAQWPGVMQPLSAAELAVRDELVEKLSAITAPIPGAFVERKAVGVSFNVRLAPSEIAALALDEAHKAAANVSGLTRHLGKGVVEWSLRPTRKGDALEALRREHGATLTVALGDDEPDLEAFDRLDHADVKILVAALPRAGVLTVPSPTQIAGWLEELAIARAENAAKET